MHLWLAFTVLTQLFAAFPRVASRYDPMLHFWSLAGQGLLAYALATGGPGKLGASEGLAALATFMALSGLPLFGGSMHKLAQAYLVSRLASAGGGERCCCGPSF